MRPPDPLTHRHAAAINSQFRIKSSDGIDSIILKRISRTRELLGAELFNGLLRGLVLADRLNAVGAMVVRTSESRTGAPPSPPAINVQGAELQALFWAVTASMKEFSDVVESLTAAGIEHLLRFSPDTLREIQSITERWKHGVFARMRNQVGVHIDPDIIERGLTLARVKMDSVALIHTTGSAPDEMLVRATFAEDVLYAGLFVPRWKGEDAGLPPSEREAIRRGRTGKRLMVERVEQTARDHGSLPNLMRTLVLDCLSALHFGESPQAIATEKVVGAREWNERTRQELDRAGAGVAGWKRRETNPEKVRRLADEIRRLREQNKILMRAARPTT